MWCSKQPATLPPSSTRLLAAVDIVDRIRTQLHDPEGLRDDLLEIHSMAHSVLNGAPSVPARGEGTLPERVLDALDQIDEFVMEFTRVRTILEPLEALHPDDGFGED
ncbi:transposase [Burkholderia sp. Ac-20384]|uniref:transposase n=1 Tax=Burkholderia sp. Ac-20384 TaxID=2703902 RepID=UPI00321697FC